MGGVPNVGPWDWEEGEGWTGGEAELSHLGSGEQGLDLGSSPTKPGNLFAFGRPLPTLTPREQGEEREDSKPNQNSSS